MTRYGESNCNIGPSYRDHIKSGYVSFSDRRVWCHGDERPETGRCQHHRYRGQQAGIRSSGLPDENDGCNTETDRQLLRRILRHHTQEAH